MKRSNSNVSQQISRMSSTGIPQKKKNPIAACCSACCLNYRHFADETVFGRAFTNNYGGLFNLVIANVLFWAAGLPRMLDCEFPGENRDSDGHVCNGEKGSGVFVITCIVFIVATTLYFYRLIRDFVLEHRYVTAVRARRAKEAEVAAEQNAEAERLAAEEKAKEVETRAREAKAHEASAARSLTHNIASNNTTEAKEVEMTAVGADKEGETRKATAEGKGADASAVAGEASASATDQPLLTGDANSPTPSQNAGKKKRRSRRKKNQSLSAQVDVVR